MPQPAAATTSRLEVVAGSIDRRDVADAATEGVTQVLHLATSKEAPETIFDVAVKGCSGCSKPAAPALPSAGSSSAAEMPRSGISSTRIWSP